MAKTLLRTHYDWPSWLRPGATHTLIRGEHYRSTDRSMATYIYRMAYKRGVKVVVSQRRQGELTVTAHKGKLDGRRH